jgi:threonine/homoserine/homoserine lactone efflux protein
MGASIATYLAPGADMAFIAANAMPHGIRAGFAAGFGILIGIVIQALAAAFGATALFHASPVIFEIVKWLGVAYLVYLGIRTLIDRSARLPGSDHDVRRLHRVIIQGIGINLLNPKISLFFFAFLPQFVNPARGQVFEQLLLLGAIFALGSVLWLSILALAFAKIGHTIAGNARAMAWQRRITGGALIGFAGALALSSIRR